MVEAVGRSMEVGQPDQRDLVAVTYDDLRAQIVDAHRKTVDSAARAVQQLLLVRNWIIGAWIVEFEQVGAERAAYGAGLLKRLAKDLAGAGLAGASPDNLEKARRFYRFYPQVRAEVEATAGRLAVRLPVPAGRLPAGPVAGDFRDASRKSEDKALQPLAPAAVLRLTWSHIVELVRVEDPWKRAFYENEILRASCSVRDLQRQIGSLLYERTALSTDKRAVIAAARAGLETSPTFADMLRDPYVLEFTGLAEKARYRESDLETALLDHLQSFLLELGNGFCFEARQKRITVGSEHDWIDLIFYHRVLRCHLLVDLKVRAFKHGDAGQMNFYLNWWRDHMVGDGDQPPVGLLLCSDKDETKVHYATAGLDHQLFVSRYQVALPSADALQRLIEADRARIEQRAAAAGDGDSRQERA